MTASSFAPQLSFSPDTSQWMMGPSWDASKERLIESTISEIGEMDMTTTNQSKKCAIQSESDRDCKFLRWEQISHTKHTMKTTNASTSALKKEMNVLFNAVTCSDIKLNDMYVQKAAQLRFVDLDGVQQAAGSSFIRSNTEWVSAEPMLHIDHGTIRHGCKMKYQVICHISGCMRCLCYWATLIQALDEMLPSHQRRGEKLKDGVISSFASAPADCLSVHIF